MLRAVKDSKDKIGPINLNRSRNIYNYVVSVIGFAQFVRIGTLSDRRVLGVKINLYDDLCEHRFTQSIGDDYYIAKQGQMALDYILVTDGVNWRGWN